MSSSGVRWRPPFPPAAAAAGDGGGRRAIVRIPGLAEPGVIGQGPCVRNDEFSDAALVLVGHGSTLNAESSAPTFQHGDELRRRRIFAEVVECFWKLEPPICGVLRGVFSPRVFVVPLFISEGYFTDEVIPRELGLRSGEEESYSRVQKRGFQTIHYCGPVGTHAAMTDVILARAREVVERHPFARSPKPSGTALFIAGHGTGLNENSRRVIEQQVELIRARGLYAEVHAIFMEEDPRIAECYRMAGAPDLVVVPFFISDGLHSYEDIPVMLGESERTVQARLTSGQPTWRNPTEKKGKTVWYTQSVGSEPHLADVILERVRESAAGQR